MRQIVPVIAVGLFIAVPGDRATSTTLRNAIVVTHIDGTWLRSLPVSVKAAAVSDWIRQIGSISREPAGSPASGFHTAERC